MADRLNSLSENSLEIKRHSQTNEIALKRQRNEDASKAALCEYCQHVAAYAPELKPGKKQVHIDHQPSITALEVSASSCPWCAVFEKLTTYSIYYPARSGPRMDQQEDRDDVRFQITLDRRENEGDTLGPVCISLEVRSISKDWSWGDYKTECAMVDSEEELSASPIWRNKTLSFEDRLETIRKWVAHCTASHPKCAAYQDACSKTLNSHFCPRRLLDLGPTNGSTQLKLVMSEDVQSKKPMYIALSHCWGSSAKPHPARTQKANEDAHKRGIILEDLPLTYRDAIKVTRDLNIRYLWIDSLCIIQDDLQDWQIEAANMASIFENAFLTIAATSSPDSHGGCHIETLNTNLAVLPLRNEEHPGKLNATFALRTPLASKETLWESPLNSRGWVLQEMALSPRTIHFHQTQLYWQCRQRLTSEDSTLDSKSFDSLRQATTHGWRGADIYGTGTWRQLARDYSSRNLSFGGDKLPAIAGLIHSHQKERGISEERGGCEEIETSEESETHVLKGTAVPVLGLWLDSLWFDLSWKPSEPFHPSPNLSHLPSWTWLSATVPIDYRSYFTAYDEIWPKLTVINWEIHWLSHPFTSKLLDWKLAVRAPLRTFDLPAGTRLEDAAQYILLEDNRLDIDIDSDVANFRLENPRLCFLHLFSDCGEDWRDNIVPESEQIFLVLSPVPMGASNEGQDTYRRIGIGDFKRERYKKSGDVDVFDGVEERTIYLV